VLGEEEKEWGRKGGRGKTTTEPRVTQKNNVKNETTQIGTIQAKKRG
jgi:hypothetical protein